MVKKEAGKKNNVHLEMRKLKQTELQRLKKTFTFSLVDFWFSFLLYHFACYPQPEDQEKQRLATLKRLKRGDENELERILRLEKDVANKELRLAVERE